jgi:hypothetical protein
MIQRAQVDKASALREFEDFLFRVTIPNTRQGLCAWVAFVFTIISMASGALGLKDGTPITPQFSLSATLSGAGGALSARKI